MPSISLRARLTSLGTSFSLTGKRSSSTGRISEAKRSVLRVRAFPWAFSTHRLSRLRSTNCATPTFPDLASASRNSALPDSFSNPRRPSVQEYRLRLKRPPPNASRQCPFKSSIAALSCSYGLFPWVGLLRFTTSLRPKPRPLPHPTPSKPMPLKPLTAGDSTVPLGATLIVPPPMLRLTPDCEPGIQFWPLQRLPSASKTNLPLAHIPPPAKQSERAKSSGT